MTQVMVSQVRLDPTATVLQAVGTDIDSGDSVFFAGDHRAMMVIYDALQVQGEEEVLADVPDWAILRRVKV